MGEEYAQYLESLAFVDDMLRSCLAHMLAESPFLARVSIVIETDFCVSLGSWCNRATILFRFEVAHADTFCMIPNRPRRSRESGRADSVSNGSRAREEIVMRKAKSIPACADAKTLL
jgi:hypothetical protein